jgi:hypothetical protein
MIDLDWLSDRLCEVLRWQLANPDAKEDADAPEVPVAGRRVWSVFLELNSTRTCGMGPNAISYLEVEAWSRLRREPVRGFELGIIRALDGAFLEAARGADVAAAEPVAGNARPMTPALFDALFAGQSG